MENQIEQQKKVVEEMKKILNLKAPKKQIWNIPTGYGKTYIFLELSRLLNNEDDALKDKKIIITTSSNQLVRKYYEIDKEIAREQKKEPIGVIEISKSNYIDPEKYMAYLKEGVLPDLIEEESLKKFTNRIESGEQNIFISDFIQNVNFIKEDVESFIKEILKQDGTNKDPFSQKITFTNHYFLLHMLKRGKKFKLDDYVILMDEVHTIGDVAETVFSNQFSIYAMKMYINNIHKNIQKYGNFHGKRSLIDKIKTFSTKLKHIIEVYSSTQNTLFSYNNNLHHENSVAKDQYLVVLNDIKNDENLKGIITKLSSKKEYSQQLSRDIQKIKEELKSISTILKYQDQSTLTYTPVKGYPLINAYQQNPLYFLHNNLWAKSKYFIGSSATVLPYDIVRAEENKYFLKRLGIGIKCKDSTDFNKIITDHYYLKHMKRIFKKENIKIVIKSRSEHKYESVYDEEFNENSKYYDDIIEYIHNNHDHKKSIIFCGGYKTAEYLAEKYMKIYDDVPVHYASPKKSSVHVLKDFEKTNKEGGLLFATRDYGVGVSLEGKKLENIFLLRLPYPVISNPKWTSLKKNVNQFMGIITKEMFITLMQFLGRLQRSDHDTGKIFIMDDRYHGNQKKLFNKILEQYGDFEKIEKQVVERKSIDDVIKEHGDLF